MKALTAARIRTLARGSEEELRAELRADLLPAAIEAVRAALKPQCGACGRGAQRWAVRLCWEMAKLVGVQPQTLIQWFVSVGAGSETEAKELVETGLRMRVLAAQGVSARESFETAMELLRLAVQEEASLRAEALKRLGGEVHVAQEAAHGLAVGQNGANTSNGTGKG